MTTSPINFGAGKAVSDAVDEYKKETGKAPTSSSQIRNYIRYDDNTGALSDADIDDIYKSLTTPVQ
jgi:hypothetical protein